jgi:hypothetical protein
VAVGVALGSVVEVALAVGVEDAAGIVAVGVGVSNGPPSGVCVGVADGPLVGDGEAVCDAATVGDGVAVEVAVSTGVEVAVDVGGADVGVGVRLAPHSRSAIPTLSSAKKVSRPVSGTTKLP